MGRLERSFMIFYWCYMLAYLCCFLGLVLTGAMERHFFHVLPFHFFGMALGIPMLILLFRDLYKRPFPNPNSKVTWTILMLMFWPSIPVYLYKHGFRPRSATQHRPAAESGIHAGTPPV